MTTRSVVCALALLPACSVFDEDLYLEIEQNEAAEQFFDACSAIEDPEIPVISESTSLELNLSNFTSHGLGYPTCSVDVFEGPDTFFILDAKQGERWNINAAPQNVDQDVAIVILGDGCASSGCENVRNRCGAGFDEHFAIVASEDKRYIVSVDSLAANSTGSISLDLDKSVCGNGIVEEGESCDGTEGCDAFCRRMIVSGTAAEGEPNDIFTGVDMIGAPDDGGRVTVTGSVGGPCDEDHYAFVVPQGASVSVHMYAPGGGPCPADTPPIDLPLVDFNAPAHPTVGVGKVTPETGGCPYFDNLGLDPDFDFTRDMPASEYHLIINARETPEIIPYEIVFDIQMATPPPM